MTQADQPREIWLPERLFYGVIFLSAVLVVMLGYFAPAALQGSFSWFTLPPLHARFIATLYLSGGVYVFAALVARRARPTRPALATILVFTGVMFLVTLRNLGAFDFSRVPVVVWFLAYLTYPLVALGLLVARGRRPAHEAISARPSGWIRSLLLIHAMVLGLLGAAMLLTSDAMVAAWPWPVTTVLVQAYSGPFLALAFCAWASADRRTWPNVVPALLALLALHVGTLLVSGLHGALFASAAVATWVWFAGFGVGAVLVTAALAVIAQQRRAEARRSTATGVNGRSWMGSADGGGEPSTGSST